jgi:hypothetical protein
MLSNSSGDISIGANSGCAAIPSTVGTDNDRAAFLAELPRENPVRFGTLRLESGWLVVVWAADSGEDIAQVGRPQHALWIYRLAMLEFWWNSRTAPTLATTTKSPMALPQPAAASLFLSQSVSALRYILAMVEEASR